MADSALPKVGELLDFLNKGISPYWDAACSERVQVAAQLKVRRTQYRTIIAGVKVYSYSQMLYI